MKKDVTGAITLLFVGIVLLLNSLGIVSWQVWGYLWKFWPIFLILSGLKIILGNSKVSNIVLSLVSVFLFAFIGTLSVFNNFSNDKGNLSKTILNVDLADYENVESIDLDINVGAFEVSLMDKYYAVKDLSEKYIYTESFTYDDYGYPELTESFYNGVLSLNFEPTFENIRNMQLYFGEYDLNYNVFLGQSEIPTDVALDLGAGKGTIQLTDKMIENMDLSVGAGQLNIGLWEDAIPSGKLMLDVGAGEVNLSLPDTVAFELNYDLGLGEITLDEDSIASFTGNSESFKSSNYEDAEIILSIEANIGLGSLNVSTQEYN